MAFCRGRTVSNFWLRHVLGCVLFLAVVELAFYSHDWRFFLFVVSYLTLLIFTNFYMWSSMNSTWGRNSFIILSIAKSLLSPLFYHLLDIHSLVFTFGRFFHNFLLHPCCYSHFQPFWIFFSERLVNPTWLLLFLFSNRSVSRCLGFSFLALIFEVAHSYVFDVLVLIELLLLRSF